MTAGVCPASFLDRRLGEARERLAEKGLDGLLVTHPPNVFYFTSFRGSAGVVLLTRDGLCLITDARYATVAKGLVARFAPKVGLTFVEVESTYEETICAVLRASGLARAGIETAHMTLARFEWLEHTLAGSGVTLCRTTGLVEKSRVVKDPYELATLREGGRRISGVMAETLSGLGTGRTEREVAADIDRAICGAGFDGPAFESIVAGGPNTALPHSRPGGRRLESGDLVMLDFGGVYDGYCLDMTRVASLGRADPDAVTWHDAVREAHSAACAAVLPGVLPGVVDAAARTVLERRGLGEGFVHGTGHGLGVEVHEAPRLGRPRLATGLGDPVETGEAVEVVGDIPLEPGMVFTVEPGVYLLGRGGVRLEDDLVVTETGCELLTSLSLDLVVI